LAFADAFHAIMVAFIIATLLVPLLRNVAAVTGPCRLWQARRDLPIPVLPESGYQAAAEERWAYDGSFISAIFRDTTLQAFEGCLFGPATGWCGLHGQLLVRIGPPNDGADPCSLTVHASPRPGAISRGEWP
jgi:hypothetical protein